MHRLIYILLIASLGFPQARKLTLENAFAIAAEQNIDLKIKKLDLGWGEKNLLQGYLSFAPSVTFDHNIVRLSDYALNLQRSQSEGFKSFIQIYANGLPPGPDRDQLLGVANSIPNTAFEQVHRSTLTASWVLYAKGQALRALAERKNRQIITEIEHTELTLDVRYRVREAYYNLKIANEALVLQKHRLQNASRRVEQMERMEKSGLRTPQDLLRFRLDKTQIESQLILAQRQVRIANVALAYELGVPLSEKLELTEEMNFSAGLFAELSEAQIDQLNVDDLNSIKKAILQLDIAKDNVFYHYGKFTPMIDVNWRKTWNQAESPFPAEQPWELSLNFSWELFSSFRDVIELQKNEINSQQAELRLEQQRRMIQLTLSEMVANLSASRKQLEAAAIAVSFATENLETVQKKHASGLVSNLDMLDAEVQFYQAKLDQLNSYKQYVLSGFSIRRILGQK